MRMEQGGKWSVGQYVGDRKELGAEPRLGIGQTPDGSSVLGNRIKVENSAFMREPGAPGNVSEAGV